MIYLGQIGMACLGNLPLMLGYPAFSSYQEFVINT